MSDVPGPRAYERPSAVATPVVQRTSLWTVIGAVTGLLVDFLVQHPEVWTQLNQTNPTVAAISRLAPVVLAALGGVYGSRQGSKQAEKQVTPVNDPAVYSPELGRLESLVPYSELLREVERARKEGGVRPPLRRPADPDVWGAGRGDQPG